MPDDEIELESCSVGDSNYAPFGSTRQYVQATFKNNTDKPVTITSISCSFTPEPRLDAQVYKYDTPVDVGPGGRSEPIIIKFTVDPGMLLGTNNARILIRYEAKDSIVKTALFEHGMTDYIITLPADPAPKSQFFISHKIPADTLLAQRLAHYLSKIGLRGYLAEDDPRYGHDMYTGKFYPEIDASKAVVVLWTKTASQDPGTMELEMDYANKIKKRLIVIKEKVVEPPPSVPTSSEYFEASSPVLESDLVNFVTKIYSAYRRGID